MSIDLLKVINSKQSVLTLCCGCHVICYCCSYNVSILASGIKWLSRTWSMDVGISIWLLANNEAPHTCSNSLKWPSSFPSPQSSTCQMALIEQRENVSPWHDVGFIIAGVTKVQIQTVHWYITRWPKPLKIL